MALRETLESHLALCRKNLAEQEEKRNNIVAQLLDIETQVLECGELEAFAATKEALLAQKDFLVRRHFLYAVSIDGGNIPTIGDQVVYDKGLKAIIAGLENQLAVLAEQEAAAQAEAQQQAEAQPQGE